MTNEEFKKIYETYSKEIFNYLRKILNSEETALEFLQDTFLNFYEQSLKTQILNVRSYLYRSARNMFIDFLRKKKENDTVPFESFENYYSQREFTHDVEWKLLRLKILHKLKEVNKIFPELFILRTDFNLKYLEISEMLKLPERTLRRYYEHIKQVIEQHFSKDLDL